MSLVALAGPVLYRHQCLDSLTIEIPYTVQAEKELRGLLVRVGRFNEYCICISLQTTPRVMGGGYSSTSYILRLWSSKRQLVPLTWVLANIEANGISGFLHVSYFVKPPNACCLLVNNRQVVIQGATLRTIAKDAILPVSIRSSTNVSSSEYPRSCLGVIDQLDHIGGLRMLEVATRNVQQSLCIILLANGFPSITGRGRCYSECFSLLSYHLCLLGLAMRKKNRMPNCLSLNVYSQVLNR